VVCSLLIDKLLYFPKLVVYGSIQHHTSVDTSVNFPMIFFFFFKDSCFNKRSKVELFCADTWQPCQAIRGHENPIQIKLLWRNCWKTNTPTSLARSLTLLVEWQNCRNHSHLYWTQSHSNMLLTHWMSQLHAIFQGQSLWLREQTIKKQYYFAETGNVAIVLFRKIPLNTFAFLFSKALKIKLVIKTTKVILLWVFTSFKVSVMAMQ